MFGVNEAYGNAAALRNYCGVSQRLPIWGEIQHSLWVNSHIKSQETRSRFFPKLFTWNDLIRIQGSIAIGDPMLYHAKNAQISAVIKKYQAIGLPKFRRSEALQARIQIYQRFLNHALELVSCESFVLALHPDELKYSEIIKGKRFREVQIYSPPPDYQPMEDYFRLLSQSRMVLSDYLGAHTFRSSLFFDSEVHLTSDLWRNPIEELKIRQLFDAYILEVSINNRRLISQEVLGVDFFKSTSELREILGFGKLKKFIGPGINAAYSFRTSK
jgi:hypothetical protein